MLHRVVFVETVVAHGITGKFHVRQLLEPGAELSALARSLSNSIHEIKGHSGLILKRRVISISLKIDLPDMPLCRLLSSTTVWRT